MRQIDLFPANSPLLGGLRTVGHEVIRRDIFVTMRWSDRIAQVL